MTHVYRTSPGFPLSGSFPLPLLEPPGTRPGFIPPPFPPDPKRSPSPWHLIGEVSGSLRTEPRREAGIMKVAMIGIFSAAVLLAGAGAGFGTAKAGEADWWMEEGMSAPFD